MATAELEVAKRGTVEPLDVAPYSPAEQTALRIREWIVTGVLPIGKRLPSERALAERLGVSRSAVRAAFDQLEGDGLVAAAPRKTRVVYSRGAETVGRGLMTRTVAVLVQSGFTRPTEAKFLPSWSGRLYQGITRRVMEDGFSVLFLSEDQLKGPGMAQLVSSPPRGLIVTHTVDDLPTRESLLKALHVDEIPVVAWGDEHGWPGCDVVLSDHEQGGYDRARWLMERGCRRLLRCRPAKLSAHDWLRRRDIGFERAVREAGLPLLPPVEIHGLRERNTDEADFGNSAHLLAGYLFPHLHGENPVDAILAVSDGFVPELAAACRILGRDPVKGLFVAGFDNCWAECPERRWETTPPSVTVDKDDERLGRELAELLLARVGGELKTEPRRVIVPQSTVLVGGTGVGGR